MSADRVQDRAISQDRTPLAYWRSGRGRPLVLVHGMTADHTRWNPVLDLLEPRVTVCAMDRRGRGASGDAEHYAIEREYEDVAAVVDAVASRSGGPVDVFGHSHGALCALEATRLTADVRKLVLYEPPVIFGIDDHPLDLVDRLDALLAEGRREDVLELFFREVVGVTDEQLALMRTLPAWPARVAAAHTIPREERATLGYRFDPERWATVSVPTLLLDGSDSPDFLRRSTETVAAALPRARVAVLDGQQHVAMDTAPDVVADTVLSFVTEV